MIPSFIGTRMRLNVTAEITACSSGAITFSISPSPCDRRTATNTTSPHASHAGPAYRAAGCVASATMKMTNVAIEPTTAGSGMSAPRTRTLKGARYGRASAGSWMRSLITASWAAVNASSTPKEKSDARNATSSSRNEVPITIPDERSAAAKIACGETCARRLSRPKLRGS